MHLAPSSFDRSPRRFGLPFATACLLVLAVLPGAAFAGGRNWTGGGTTSSWSDTANWSGAISGNAVTFGGSVQTTNSNNISGLSIQSITFAAGASPFTLGGNALTLSNGSITNSSTSTQTIDLASITLGANATFAATAGNLVISSGLAGTTTLEFTAGAGFGTTLSGSSSRSAATTVTSGFLTIQNPFALGSTAAGTTVSSGAALQLAGGITVNGEALSVTGAGISSDGALRSISGTNIWNGTITIQADGDRINSDAGLLTLSGTVTGNGLNDNIVFGGAGDITVSGPLTIGNATVTKDGAGRLTISGSANNSQATTISAGVLRAQNNFALGTTAAATTVTAGAALELAGGISIGAEGLTLNGSGISATGALRNVSGTNTYGGAITFNTAATIAADAGSQLNLTNTLGGAVLKTFAGAGNISASNVISGAAGLTMTGTGTLTLSAANTYTGTTTISSGTLSASSIVVAASASNLGNATSAVALGDASNQGTLSYTGSTATYTRGFSLGAGGGRLNVTTAGQTLTVGGTGNIGGTGLFTVGGDGNVTVSSTLAQSGGLVKTGAGTLALSSSNTYSGATSIEQGTVTASRIVVAAGASSLGNATSAVTLGGANTSGTLSYTGSTATYTRGFTLGAGGGRLDVTAAGQTLTIATGSVGGTGIFTVGGSGSVDATAVIATIGGLTKTGNGTLTLSGLNTFGGVLSGSAGVIRATTTASALGAGSVTLAGAALELANDTGLDFGRNLTVASSGTIFSERLTPGAGVTHTLGDLTIGGQSLTVATDASVTSGTAALVFSGATLTGDATFAVDAGTSLTMTGAMTGAFGITKSGAGVLTLADASGHTNTTVSAGRLNVNARAALGTSTGTLSIGPGTTLGNTSGASLTLINAKSISLGSSLTFAGPFDLNLANGTTTLSAATTTMDVTAGTLTFDGNIVGNGLGITKTGTGTLVFGGLGAGAYTGNTLISQGELFLDGPSVFGGGTSTIVTIQNGAFLRIGASASLGGVTLNSWTGGLITGTTVDANVTWTTSGTLTPSDSFVNGTQTISSEIVVSSTANFFGTVPATPVSNRITIQAGSTLQALANFDINPNQGVLLQSGTGTFSVVGSGSLAPRLFLESAVSGSGTLRKTGGGNLRLLGTNSYTGGTIIEQGIIGISSDAALGTGGLQIIGSEFVGAQTAAGAATDVTVNASRSIAIGNGTTSAISAQTGNRLAYAGAITEINGGGAAGNLRVGLAGARAGTVVLGGANTYRGSTSLVAGTLDVAVLANGGVASGVGQSSSAAANLVLQGGSKLKFSGGNASTDRLFTLGAGGATIDSGSGTLAFTNSGNAALAGTGARSLTLAGSGSASLAVVLADLDAGSPTSLRKTGAGTWELTTAQQFTGNTSLEEGSLVVDGSLVAGVSSAGGTTLGGSGSIGGTISGAGLVSPGNSPGILTAGSFDGSTGLDVAFEITGSVPVYGNPAASVNDVLRLTGGDPFAGTSLAAGNVIDVYLNVDSVGYQQQFEGGFFTTQSPESLLAAVSNATVVGWVKTTGAGQRTFNSVNYDPIGFTPGLTRIQVATKAATADFGDGQVSGSVTVFIAVPEPTGALAALIGLAGAGWWLRQVRGRRKPRATSVGS